MRGEIVTALLFADGSSDDPVKEVVADTINYAIVATSIGIGMAVGLAVAAVLMFAASVISRGHHVTRRFLRHCRTSLFVTNALWFGHIGLITAEDNGHFNSTGWVNTIDHVLVVATIAAATWMLVSGAQTIEDVARRSARSRRGGDIHRASRLATQGLMIRRIVQGIFLLLGAAAIAMTFPAARTAIASMLASAGIASIVATLAAQSMLANIFAGFQLAMTDALRVNDIVVVSGLDGVKMQGTVEEITLTYVVVHVWDGRRIVIPSSKFTTSEFENLTRRQTEMMASIELHLDFRAPLTQIRAHVDELLAQTDMWDGKDANVQVTAATESTMTVRVVVSATNTANAWDLGCRIREGLFTWIAREHPYALPRSRFQHLDVQQVKRDLAEEEIAELAEELAGIRGTELGRGQSRITVESHPADLQTDVDREHQARLRAAKERAHYEVQRRSIMTTPPPDTLDQPAIMTDPTIAIPAEELPNTQTSATVDDTQRTLTGDRLYSGTPTADERGRTFSGPAPYKRENTPDDEAQ